MLLRHDGDREEIGGFNGEIHSKGNFRWWIGDGCHEEYHPNIPEIDLKVRVMGEKFQKRIRNDILNY